MKKSVSELIDQTPKGPKLKKLFDSKRSQAVCISIAKMAKIKEIEYAFEKMDNTILNCHHVNSLLKEFVTDDELAELKNQGGLDVNWEKGEDFMLKLARIPQAKRKLRVWKICNEFEENRAGIEGPFKRLKQSTEAVLNSKNLKSILSIVLRVGNVLNGGDKSKGQADGFNLDNLLKLSSIKDKTGRSLLQLVCEKVKQEFSGFTGLKEEFGICFDCSKFKVAEIKALLTKLDSDLQLLDREIEELCKAKKDDFLEAILHFRKGIVAEFKALAKEVEDTIQLYQTTVLKFGYQAKDSKYINTDEFFDLIWKFTQEVDKSMPKQEKKAFNRVYDLGSKILKDANIESIYKSSKN